MGFSENLSTVCQSISKHWKVPFACDIVFVKMMPSLNGNKKSRKPEYCLHSITGVEAYAQNPAPQLTSCLGVDISCYFLESQFPGGLGFLISASLLSSKPSFKSSKFLLLYFGYILEMQGKQLIFQISHYCLQSICSRYFLEGEVTVSPTFLW